MTFWWILLSLPHSRHPSLQTRHRGEHGWSQRLDVVGDGQRGALVEADAAALLQDRNLHQSLQHVRQWEVGEVARVFVGGDASVETAAERGDEVLVRDERALRHAGGARGVADRAHVRGLRRDVGDAVRVTELLDLAHAVESDVLGGKRRERGHGRLRELAVLVGDVLHLDDHLQRHVLLSHRQHLHRLRSAADDSLHLRLTENVQNGVGAESLVCGNEREVVGVAGLLGDAPLQSVAREDSQTLVLHYHRGKTPTPLFSGTRSSLIKPEAKS